jgi:hypothetical protein
MPQVTAPLRRLPYKQIENSGDCGRRLMSRPFAVHTPKRPQELRIRPVLGNELKDRIREAVAWRAYRLYEECGRVLGHDVEDWERAEAEVVRSMDCGVIAQDHRVCLTTDVSLFDDGPLELYVEPHRITLCGFDRSRRPLPTPPGVPARPRKDWIFRVHDFDVEVDPHAIVVRYNGPALYIYLATVEPREAERVLAAAS